MAYFDKIFETETCDKLYAALRAKISAEAESMYQAKLKKAKTPKQKQACSGQYKGEWFALLEGWMQNKISNLHVRTCLEAGYVIKP